MTAAQGRLADTIDVLYGAADKSSEGAMAAHAYKRAVDDLDAGIGRELVRQSGSICHRCSTKCNFPLTRMHRTGRLSWNLWGK